jgi:hypothetical protein
LKPALLCIDANAGTVSRYWPKYTGGFLVDKTTIEPDALNQLGSPENLAGLEGFRQRPDSIDKQEVA